MEKKEEAEAKGKEDNKQKFQLEMCLVQLKLVEPCSISSPGIYILLQELSNETNES